MKKVGFADAVALFVEQRRMKKNDLIASRTREALNLRASRGERLGRPRRKGGDNAG